MYFFYFNFSILKRRISLVFVGVTTDISTVIDENVKAKKKTEFDHKIINKIR